VVEEIYIIDTSSFIAIEPEKYPPDIYVGMWKDLENLIKKRRMISHIQVLEELKEYEGKKDEILKWAENHKDVFVSITPQQIQLVREIINTNDFKALIDTTKPTGDTDAFIIALAMEEPFQMTLPPLTPQRIVVCEEKLHGNRIRIPFVCRHFNIECIDIFEMFRREGWKW
jgi:hypothetical protein